MIALVSLAVLVGGSIGLAAWIASRLSRVVIAFFTAWALTPLFLFAGTLVLIPVFRAAAAPTNDGTWVIMIPIYGILLGLLSAIIAAVMVSARRRRAAASVSSSQTP